MKLARCNQASLDRNIISQRGAFRVKYAGDGSSSHLFRLEYHLHDKSFNISLILRGIP